MRVKISGSSTRSPSSSRNSKPRPRRRRVIPGPEQSTLRSLAMADHLPGLGAARTPNPQGRRPLILDSMPPQSGALSAAQLDAVTHPGGPLLVVAGAGTGKTRVVTERFAWLVAEGTPPDCILALTYSNAAAGEMRERLETMIESSWEELPVATLHSFCARLLRDESLEAGVDPFFSPVTPADRLAILLDRLDELTLRRHEIRGNPARLLGSFVSRIDRLKDETVTPAEYLRYAESLAANAHDDAERAHADRELEVGRAYEHPARRPADSRP